MIYFEILTQDITTKKLLFKRKQSLRPAVKKELNQKKSKLRFLPLITQITQDYLL